VAIWPSVPQAQSSRLSSVFFPFSVFQPILNVGLRLPASSLIPLRRSRRPCGFVEPLCFTGAAQSAFLAPSEPLGHASPASSRQRSATLAADFGLVDPIASIYRSGRSSDSTTLLGFFPFAALILPCRVKRFFDRFDPACRWMNIHLDNFCSRDRSPFE